MTTNCRFVATDEPRVLSRRHTDACQGAGPYWHPPMEWVDCSGCQPCPEPPFSSARRETMSEAGRCANTNRPLTHSLDLTEEGLAMKATRTCSVAVCLRPVSSRGWCKSHYERWRTTGDAGEAPVVGHKLGPNTRNLPFWDRVGVIEDEDSCWEWAAGSQRNQRARMRYEGRDQFVYRIAWQLTNGPIPAGLCVCHRCDNPLCCRPSHLFLGTHGDNMTDGRAKGRIPLPANAPKGQAHHDATASDEQVAEARTLYATGIHSQRKLARQFGVTQSNIGSWVRGESRRDAGGPITKVGSHGKQEAG